MAQEIIDKDIKINFVGSQGTGKSTLLQAMKEDPMFKNFSFKTEIIRDLIKKGKCVINENGNAKSQQKFFDKYLDLLSNETKFVSDRCIIDVYAYTSWLYDHKETISQQEMKSLYREILRQRYFVRNRQYGIVIYFPIEFELVDDGVRSLNPKFQKEIDEIIIDTLERFQIDYYKVTGSVEQRLEQVKKIIKSYVESLEKL